MNQHIARFPLSMTGLRHTLKRTV